MIILTALIIIYIITAKNMISVYVDADNTRVEKNSPVEYEITVINHSPFPFPFTCLTVSVPSENGVRCSLKKLNISLTPLGRHDIKQKISFKYRGGYDIGINSVYVSDFFGLFQIRVSSELYRRILVFPEKLMMPEAGKHSVTDLPTDLTKRAYGSERSEPANIREYIPGDSLKDVHWKLYSKLQEMQVKDYNTNNSRNVYIICDTSFLTEEPEKTKQDVPDKKQKKTKKGSRTLLEKRKKDAQRREKAEEKARLKALKREKKKNIRNKKVKSDKTEPSSKIKNKDKKISRKIKAMEIAKTAWENFNADNKKSGFYSEVKIKPEYIDEAPELLCDGVLELALAAARRESREGNNCTIICPDIRFQNKVYAYMADSYFENSEAFISFSTTPVFKGKLDLGSILSAVSEDTNITLRYVTANIDFDTISAACALPSMFGGIGSGCSEDYMLFEDDSLYEDTTARKNYTCAARAELIQNGISFSVFRRNAISGVSEDFTRSEF